MEGSDESGRDGTRTVWERVFEGGWEAGVRRTFRKNEEDTLESQRECPSLCSKTASDNDDKCCRVWCSKMVSVC